jgi:hypothetical protein
VLENVVDDDDDDDPPPPPTIDGVGKPNTLPIDLLLLFE